MIKLRRLPFRNVMATRAIRAVAVDLELVPMNVFMAANTVFRGHAEANILDTPPQVLRPMTVRAGHHTMSSEERKLRLRVVKFHHVFPGLQVVAAEAIFFATIQGNLLDARRKLSSVRIIMAGLTFEQLKLVLCRWQWKTVCWPLVTLQTRNSDMPIRQSKASLTMPGKCKSAGLKPLYRMAGLTAVQYSRAGKLAVMDILVTVQTSFVLETIERLGSIRNVAFSADDRFVFSRQWVARFLMMFQGECRWFKSLFHMTTSTFAMIRAICKLSVVRIYFMAIHTKRMR